MGCADSDCYYAARCLCSCDVTSGSDAGCNCEPSDYDCASPYLTAPNDGSYGRMRGISEGQEACYVKWKDVSTRATFDEFKIVRCQNGVLVPQDNCMAYFAENAQVSTSHVYCAPDSSRTPSTAATAYVHCMPGSAVSECAFYGLEEGTRQCYSTLHPQDIRMADAQFLAACFSDLHPSVTDPTAYQEVNPYTGATYSAFLDCGHPEGGSAAGGGGFWAFSLAGSGECLHSDVLREDTCLPAEDDTDFGYIRTAHDAYVADWDANENGTYAHFTHANNFPQTQNLVTCMNPTANNTTPYVQLDTLGQLYTDYDAHLMQSRIEEMHDNGIKYLNYSGFWGPEQRPGLGWYDAGYQYGYWRDKWGIDVVPEECWDIDQDGLTNLMDNCPRVYNPLQTNTPEVRENGEVSRDGLGDACDPDYLAWSYKRALNPAVCNTNPNNDAACGTPTAQDPDGDGITGAHDNCPVICNPLNAFGNQKAPLVSQPGKSCAEVAAQYCPAQTHTNPRGLSGCASVSAFDVDGDGFANNADTCPTVCNPEQSVSDTCSDAQTFVTSSQVNDYDEDGVSNDNCPTVYNAEVYNERRGVFYQPDDDNDGIGDACDDDTQVDEQEEQHSTMACEYLLKQDSIARIDPNGRPSKGAATQWHWDMCRPVWLQLYKRMTQFFIDTGADGTTWDVAGTADCYSDEAVARFRRWLTSIESRVSPPNPSPYVNLLTRAKAEVLSVSSNCGGSFTLNASTFDIRAYRHWAETTSDCDCAGAANDCNPLNSGSVWTTYSPYTSRLWFYYEQELVDETTGLLDTYATSYAASQNKPYIGFYNNGTGVRFDHLKALPGSETFVVPSHPLSGASQGFNGDGMPWPVVTLEYLYDMHQTYGKRFWNWTLPTIKHDDRNALYVAEAIANGGIVQAGGCDIEYLENSSRTQFGYMRPNYLAWNAQKEVMQFFSDNFAYTGLARNARDVGVYWSDVVNACGDVPDTAMMFYQLLRDLHYNVELIPGGPFHPTCTCDPDCGVSTDTQATCFCDTTSNVCDHTDAPVHPLTESQLWQSGQRKHQVVIIPGPAALSAAEKAAFTAYAQAGGTVIKLPYVGSQDEWCGNGSSWYTNPSTNVGSGRIVSLTTNPFQEMVSDSPSRRSDQVTSEQYQSYFGCGVDPGPSGVLSMNAQDAFSYALRPNRNVDLSADLEPCGESYTQIRGQVDVQALRRLLDGWLAWKLNTYVSRPWGGVLPYTVHTQGYVDAEGLPVWHFVNYDMDLAVLPSYTHAVNAGAGSVYTNVEVGRAKEISVPVSVPVPSALQAAGGTLRIERMGYTTPITVNIPMNSTAVAVTLVMKQWAVLHFIPSP
jgi:hypothetical protein